mmetsp:Transcript_35884/g.73736  ORF Transcript_35884/g.73736 Transcript_35884/m.73736 type:complete len:393 (-) Transcript_35884:36-1214(-)|eukprot:CAMPEP_0181295076 /NCGR_PEP_ID=MMETSP1101-20121128/3945_1 /TAXON_ID=46948 /ORGANISM="Rhodomonas abbreviata, Strain Caron Lab Isolate" /LENGTH=392 /DNA_ID=CAMNT_0023399785 /DNA_START=125 /DNA_END=1303 /DNA_ORIENTATION=+
MASSVRGLGRVWQGAARTITARVDRQSLVLSQRVWAERSVRSFHATPPSLQGYERFERPWNTVAILVPQQMAYVVERFGKFSSVLDPGLNIILPFVDRVAYVHSLKEEALSIPNQMAITSDNVTLQIDGVLYVRIMDPYKASYGVSDALYAITQLAQTTMRSELGKMSLDSTFKDRDTLNAAIVNSIAAAALNWGVEALRYEIRDIQAPKKIKEAMDQQAEAERRKRAQVLDSEAEQLSEINIAEGRKRAQVLASEAQYAERVNQARGEAEAILKVAEASARSIEVLGKAIQSSGGKDAVTLRVAERYIQAFEKLAKESTAILLPSNASDPSAMVGAAMGVYSTMNKAQHKADQENKDTATFARSKLEELRKEVEGELAASMPPAGGPSRDQ